MAGFTTCDGCVGETGPSVISRDEDELENRALLDREKVGVTGEGDARSDEDDELYV